MTKPTQSNTINSVEEAIGTLEILLGAASNLDMEFKTELLDQSNQAIELLKLVLFKQTNS